MSRWSGRQIESPGGELVSKWYASWLIDRSLRRHMFNVGLSVEWATSWVVMWVASESRSQPQPSDISSVWSPRSTVARGLGFWLCCQHQYLPSHLSTNRFLIKSYLKYVDFVYALTLSKYISENGKSSRIIHFRLNSLWRTPKHRQQRLAVTGNCLPRCPRAPATTANNTRAQHNKHKSGKIKRKIMINHCPYFINTSLNFSGMNLWRRKQIVSETTEFKPAKWKKVVWKYGKLWKWKIRCNKLWRVRHFQRKLLQLIEK